ncbi:MAG: YceD family protein [Erythrobacter sp.]
MSAPTTDFSRLFKVKALPGQPIVLEASAGERAALSDRFGLPGVDSLRAVIELEQRGASIRARGTLEAAIRQTCATSGEDFPAQISEEVDLRFVERSAPEPHADGDIEIELDAADCDEFEYYGDTFDLGEAIAQTLGLAIDPYAEGPEADGARQRAGITADGQQDGPLAAALLALKRG